MNFFDKAINHIAPVWGLKRTQARMANDLYRNYLEAGRPDRGGEAWKKVSASPSDVFKLDGALVRDRAKYLVGSDPYVSGMLNTLVSTVVGTGIKTSCQIEFSKKHEVNEARNKVIEDLKKRWNEEVDAIGNMHRNEMQELILKTVAGEGEVLMRRMYKDDSSRVSPLCYEIISADRLVDYGTNPLRGNEVINGIEYEPDSSIPVAHHVSYGQYSLKSKRIPVDEINHIFRVDRPGQDRGITWLAPVIPDCYMLHDIKDYAVIARKVQSAIAVIVSDNPNNLGAGGTIPGLVAPSGVTKENAAGDNQSFIQPGMIHHAGTGNVTSHVPAPSNDLDPLTRLLLRSIGIGFGMSYEYISGDYERTNFAGGRLGQVMQRQKIMPVHGFMINHAEKVMHKDFIDSIRLTGDLRVPANLNPYAAQFSKPEIKWGVNPIQEVKAALMAVEGNISTLRDEVEGTGKDFYDVIMQKVKEKKILTEADLVDIKNGAGKAA